MANLRKGLEQQHSIQLQQLCEQKDKEMNEIKALHKLELAEYETKMSADIAYENEIQELKVNLAINKTSNTYKLITVSLHMNKIHLN
jgi:hypothetical protein